MSVVCELILYREVVGSNPDLSAQSKDENKAVFSVIRWLDYIPKF